MGSISKSEIDTGGSTLQRQGQHLKASRWYVGRPTRPQGPRSLRGSSGLLRLTVKWEKSIKNG